MKVIKQKWHDPEYWELFDPEPDQIELHKTAIKEVTQLADKIYDVCSRGFNSPKTLSILKSYRVEFANLCDKYADLGMADTEPREAMASILIKTGFINESQWFRFPKLYDQLN